MRKPFVLWTGVIVALLAMGAIIAQEDSDDAPPSLCTDGTWTCADHQDSAREAWNWACGWYWGHLYAGLIDAVPAWCQPSESTPSPDPSVTGGGSVGCDLLSWWSGRYSDALHAYSFPFQPGNIIFVRPDYPASAVSTWYFEFPVGNRVTGLAFGQEFRLTVDPLSARSYDIHFGTEDGSRVTWISGCVPGT
jgi:hypothetical protein